LHSNGTYTCKEFSKLTDNTMKKLIKNKEHLEQVLNLRNVISEKIIELGENIVNNAKHCPCSNFKYDLRRSHFSGILIIY
jgi:hypothetical protein